MDIALAGAVDRRAFLKTALVAGVAVVVRPLASAAQPQSFGAREAASSPGWRRTATTAARRIDGPPKVTGAKLYAADFRAQDMPGWPRATAHAVLLKTPDATHVFEGIDLAMLDRELSARSGRARRRPGGREDHRAGFLRRRPALPCRQDAALSRSAGRAADLERFRPLRARQAGDPVRAQRAPLRPADRPGRREALRGRALRARRRRDAGGRGRLFADARGLDLSDPLSQGRPSGLGGAGGDRLRRATRVLLRRPDPRRDRGRQPRPARARAQFPDPVDRPGFHGAGSRPRLVRQRRAQARAGDRRPVAAAGRRQRGHAGVEEFRRQGGRQGCRPLRRRRRRLRRQGPHHLPALRRARRPVLAQPPGASRQRSLRPVPVRHQAPRHRRAQPDGGRSQERPHRRLCRRPGSRRGRPRQPLRRGRLRRRYRVGRHLRRAEGRRYDGRAALARRHRRLDARLRRAADHDGARGDDRRGGGAAGPGSGRLPQGQPAQDRRQDHGRQCHLGGPAQRRGARPPRRQAAVDEPRGRESPPRRRGIEQGLWRRPRLRQHRVRHRLRSGLRAGRARSRPAASR